MFHLKRSTRKPLSWISLLVILPLLLTACGGETTGTTTPAASTNPTAAVAAPTDTTAAAAPTNTTAMAAPTDTSAAAAGGATATTGTTEQATVAAQSAVTSTATTAGAAAAVPTVTVGPMPTGPVTLKIMHWTDQMVEGTPWWKAVLDGFKKKYPNVTIENNFVPFAQYLPTLDADAASNSLPDLFFAHVEAAQLGRAGRTIDYRQYFDDSFFKDFFPGALQQFTFDGGKLYALPWTAQIFGLFVDTTVMQQLGLQPPETWDDLIAMAPKIRAAGYTPLMFGNQAQNVCPDFFLPLVKQEGGDVFALDDIENHPGLSWNSQPVIDAFALLKKLVDAKVFVEGINGVSENQGWQLAFQGKAAMLYSGSWVPPVIDQQAPPDYAKSYTVAKFPALTKGAPHWSGDGSGEGWAVNASSPNKVVALEFLKYLYNEDVYNTAFKGYQSMPARLGAMSVIQNPKVKEMASWFQDGTDHILYGKGDWNAIANQCQGILDGSITDPAAAAAQVQKDVEAAMKH